MEIEWNRCGELGREELRWLNFWRGDCGWLPLTNDRKYLMHSCWLEGGRATWQGHGWPLAAGSGPGWQPGRKWGPLSHNCQAPNSVNKRDEPGSGG